MKVFHAAASLALMLAFSDTAAATAQVADTIVVDGKPEMLHTNPLEGWLEEHPKALPEDVMVSSANWRGYTATWVLGADSLRLRAVTVRMAVPGSGSESGYRESAEVDVTARLFPKSGDIVATWYSGTLVVPRGEMVRYVHMGYGSEYERYTIVSIAAGKVQRRRDFTHPQFEKFRDAQYAAWKRTPDFATKVAELRQREKGAFDEDFWDGFLRSFYAEHYLSLEFDTKE